jgi:hypothetical protein
MKFSIHVFSMQTLWLINIRQASFLSQTDCKTGLTVLVVTHIAEKFEVFTKHEDSFPCHKTSSQDPILSHFCAVNKLSPYLFKVIKLYKTKHNNF